MSEPVPPAEASAPEVFRCARHPDIETGLRCGRCETPICPRCMVMTPVGARCPDCAQLRRLPTFDVRPRHYAAALAAAVGVAVAIGVAWSLLPIPRGSAAFLLGLLSGVAAGEAVSRVVNRKRSRGLKAIAALAVPLTLWVSVWAPALPRIIAMAAQPGSPSVLETLVLLAWFVTANPFVALGLAFGAYVATTRIDR